MADPIREALERAARELQLVAATLIGTVWEDAGSRAHNEAHAARAALAAQPPAPAPASDGEREKRAVDALTRLYWWGGLSAEYGYSSDVVLGVRDWIDGGMAGDLPPLPAWIADRCPPLLPSAQPPQGGEVQQ